MGNAAPDLVCMSRTDLSLLISSTIEQVIKTVHPPPPVSCRGQGFSLYKRENKKNGFLYYVRYRHEGKMLPSKWNTGTNDFRLAQQFAVENRERIISQYLGSRQDSGMFTLLEAYYQKDSPYLVRDMNRNRSLCDHRRRIYLNFTVKSFIPFLRQAGIFQFTKIKPATLATFQDELLARGLQPQTINSEMGGLSKIFEYVTLQGMIENNPFKQLSPLAVKASNVKRRGCYDVQKLKGVFASVWPDELSHLLCLVVYGTGLRNGEILRLRVSDIVYMGGCRFLDIKASKTENGIRRVPLHDFVYARLEAHFAAHGLAGNDLMFPSVRDHHFKKANLALAEALGGEHNKETLPAQNITFYSGRHFWKTMLNAHELGEGIEEIFMAHKVPKDVAARYNHRDKQGLQKYIEKTKRCFAILDEALF